MINKQYVLFDLDHTLSDALRRDHLIEQARASNEWDTYHLDSINDGVCTDLLELLTCFRHTDFRIIGITARPSKYRSVTEEWLTKNGILLDELLMNPRYNWEPSAELKIGMARERFGENFADEILMIIDDHSAVIKAFQAAGVTAMQVHGRRYG